MTRPVGLGAISSAMCVAFAFGRSGPEYQQTVQKLPLVSLYITMLTMRFVVHSSASRLPLMTLHSSILPSPVTDETGTTGSELRFTGSGAGDAGVRKFRILFGTLDISPLGNLSDFVAATTTRRPLSNKNCRSNNNIVSTARLSTVRQRP